MVLQREVLQVPLSVSQLDAKCVNVGHFSV